MTSDVISNPYDDDTAPGAVDGSNVLPLVRSGGKPETAARERLIKQAEKSKKDAETQARRKEIQARSKELSDLHDDIPDGYETPAGWICDSKGILKLVERRDGDLVEVRVAYGPIIPVATHTDPDGAQLVELLWNDGHRWVNRLVPRSIAKSGKKLVAAVGDAGFPATEASGRDVEQWLAAAEAYNRGVIREHRIARWLGWQSDGTFISSPDDARVELAYPEQKSALNAHRPRGTLEGWQAAVAAIEDLPVAKMALYAGLAAPLIDVVKVDSFTIDFAGRSTRGKTTAAKIGLSCWADPSEKGDGTFSWRTTILAVEKRLNLVRGLPVLLDETRLVVKPEDVDTVLYQIPKNHGKPRGGGYPSMLPWSTIVISTGEQPALSFTSHQGASARVLGITQPPFARDGEAAVTVGRGIDEHYGHAGPLFVARLREWIADEGGRDELIRQHRELAEKLKGGNDLSARRAPLVACLALAAELCETWSLTPGLTRPPLKKWLELFTCENATDNRPEMALDLVREYVAANGAALWRAKVKTYRNEPSTGWIGRLDDVGDQQAVCLLPNRLRQSLTRAGVELETVLPAWIENGWLVKSGDTRRPYEPVKRLAGVSTRMYTFAPDVVKVSADTDGAETSHDGYVQSPDEVD